MLFIDSLKVMRGKPNHYLVGFLFVGVLRGIIRHPLKIHGVTMLELFYTTLVIGFGWHVAGLAIFALSYIGAFVISLIALIIGSFKDKP